MKEKPYMTTMAVDQYGHVHHDLGNHPRKALLAKLARRHADKMYQDSDGGPKHIGYIIGGLWLTIFRVTEWTSKRSI